MSVRAICLRLLTTRPYTRTELVTALASRGVAEESAHPVLDQLEAAGLIDDRSFADAWVESRHHGRGLARRALATELRLRGIPEETAQAALDRVDQDTEVRTARALVARRLGRTRGLDPPVRARRLLAMLLRRGYPRGVATRVVHDTLAEDAGVTPVLEEMDGPGLEY